MNKKLGIYLTLIVGFIIMLLAVLAVVSVRECWGNAWYNETCIMEKSIFTGRIVG